MKIRFLIQSIVVQMVHVKWNIYLFNFFLFFYTYHAFECQRSFSFPTVNQMMMINAIFFYIKFILYDTQSQKSVQNDEIRFWSIHLIVLFSNFFFFSHFARLLFLFFLLFRFSIILLIDTANCHRYRKTIAKYSCVKIYLLFLIVVVWLKFEWRKTNSNSSKITLHANSARPMVSQPFWFVVRNLDRIKNTIERDIEKKRVNQFHHLIGKSHDYVEMDCSAYPQSMLN